jgi:hypothetical protein
MVGKPGGIAYHLVYRSDKVRLINPKSGRFV